MRVQLYISSAKPVSIAVEVVVNSGSKEGMREVHFGGSKLVYQIGFQGRGEVLPFFI